METTAVRESSIFDPGVIAPSADTNDISADTPRYCFVPLLRKDVSGADFRVPDGHLPINQIFVVRSFDNKITDVANGGKRTVPRTAAAQADDIYRLAAREGGLDFPDLAKLQDSDARLICDVLENPNVCEKYPYENSNVCMSCWGQYLNRAAGAQIAELPASLQDTAHEVRTRLLESVERAQTFARDSFRLSVDAIEGNKKARLSNQDRVNMRHVHLEEPNFSGVMGQSTGLGKEIAKGITEAMGAPKMDTGAIATIIAEQLAPMQEKIAKLEAENEALRGGQEVVHETCAGNKTNGDPCNAIAQDDGYCRHHKPDEVVDEG